MKQNYYYCHDNDNDGDGGLGLRMQENQRKESFSTITTCTATTTTTTTTSTNGQLLMSHYHNNHNPFDSSPPSFHVDSSSTYSASVSVGGSDFSIRSLQQYFPFDSSAFGFNPSGEMTPRVNVRAPFSATQLQELERQTLIYKYMMASVPVPSELLMPINNSSYYKGCLPNASIHSQSNSPLMELGISSCCVSTNSDLEPWRCKRTDGKKWRCSRDVVPDQKYCERHSHRNRPRSRKPVELHTDSTTVTTVTTPIRDNNYSNCVSHRRSYLPKQTTCHLSMFPSATAYDQRRSLDWFLKGETVPVANNTNQDWHLLRRENDIKDSEQAYDIHQHYEEQLLSNSFLNSGSDSPQSTTRLIASLEEPLNLGICHPQARETRHFLDAWSTAARDDSKTSSSGDVLPISSLTLSMYGTYNEENESGHGSWIDGGPLGEALLCLGIPSSARVATASSSLG